MAKENCGSKLKRPRALQRQSQVPRYLRNYKP
ncbi:hypothetical protein ACVWXM_002215 [Bradyrhizobium sp. GM7.3]